jgi:hypothetical protein
MKVTLIVILRLMFSISIISIISYHDNQFKIRVNHCIVAFPKSQPYATTNFSITTMYYFDRSHTQNFNLQVRY